ncbi:hypothetical protein N8817_07595 [Flavobacteriaceae bacterium]|nr:hypothetical protein [Flavobacteriaceae bacterium]MDA9851802.1 hypothetical protein [Flavobacteriaceae bacterium]MDC0386670.1 hypothetical protein [Flavobacteriaceae bacterium]
MDRRAALKTYSLVMLGLSVPRLTFAKNELTWPPNQLVKEKIPEHFPNIDPKVIAEVVGKSHFDLERVKKLVDKRPELSRSVWEWRFGDFESAIGAASHVGRRDIALYLISKGARPTLFTFAMLGYFNVVKSTIEAIPGIEEITGPHGISLLDHAYAGQRMKDRMSGIEIEKLEQTIAYLTKLGNAGGEKYLDVSSEEQEKYLGNYKYGEKEKDGFTININMRKLLSLGPIGEFGGALYKTGENHFIYNGAPSVQVTFDIRDNKVYSMKIKDPDLTIVAQKVS